MISVVVPSFREGARLFEAIERLTHGDAWGEIIVAAHAEAPRVPRLAARRWPRLRWVECPRACRGEQLALGAGAAAGDILLFLHADTRLPAGAAAAIEAAVAAPGIVGGAFRLAFDSAHPALHLLSRLSASSWRVAYFGDQGLFCHRNAYDDAGGFRAVPLFEDVDLVRRLSMRGRLARLPLTVVTSARRFAPRPWRRLALNASLMVRYYSGASPAELARTYCP